MNTNRDASQRTQYNKTKALAAYYQTTKNSINAGNVVLAPGRYSDRTASMTTGVVVGQTECCTSDNVISESSGPSYTTFYEIFDTVGEHEWVAPATCQSPITYWIVGGGGGGGGAYDNGGGGGGGAGGAVTGTYAVVPGESYLVFVGAGGDGGTSKTITSDTPAESGEESSFGGISAVGGGAGSGSRNYTLPGGSGVGGGASIGGNGGGSLGGGGGGGGATTSGTNGTFVAPVIGLGGTGVSFTIPGYNGGSAQVYGVGGNGGLYTNAPISPGYLRGASGTDNTGNGGGGGSARGGSPPGSNFIPMGGDGGSGLVVIQYSA
jgi:hypothetical protein